MSSEVKTIEQCTIKVTPEQEKWVCLCYLCFPNGKEYCELIPDCWLFENEGKFGLMCQPGHGLDHAIIMFPDKPWQDPDRECEHEDDEIAKLSDKWIDTVCDWADTVRMRPEDGHMLVEACKAAGWHGRPNEEAHPILLHWLYDLAGRKLAEHESRPDSGDHPATEPADAATKAEGDVDDGGGTGSPGVAQPVHTG